MAGGSHTATAPSSSLTGKGVRALETRSPTTGLCLAPGNPDRYICRALKFPFLASLVLATTCLAQQEKPDLEALQKRATGGDAEAQIALGLAYDEGRGVKQDREKAAVWFAKAAAQGVAEAQFNLGIMYAAGVGVAKDEAKAIEWLDKAATQGLVDAQFNLANMYASGRGTAKNFTKALEWYEKAATKGMTRAQFNLGLMYAMGQGVPKDTEKAYAWFAVAAAEGDPAAKQNRDYIEKNATTAAKKAKLQKAAEGLAKTIKP
jgi:TPR repeat protein